jgi:hypothetical protein
MARPRWYTLSLDEVKSLEDQRQELQIEPARKVTAMLDAVISMCLESLGVDCSQDPTMITFQQQQLDIVVAELTPEQLQLICQMTRKGYDPKALGYYIYRKMEPIFFIPDPYLADDGRVIAEFCSFKKNIVVRAGTTVIPLKM